MPESPIVIRTPRDMSADSRATAAQGRRIGFVPTMGALHQGHASLVRWTRANCDRLVVSIFVNPLQFDRAEDLNGYPRTFERDMEILAAEGVDVVYNPTPGAMYPEGFQTKVAVAQMTAGLCGAHRPGHFDGVTTVVLKLFNAVRPDLAAFGQKDYQQLKVIERMVRDLDLGVEVVGRPTVREDDGLAMSSRNVHLSPEERSRALCLWRGLNRAREAAKSGETGADRLRAAALAEIEGVPGAKVEYLELVDAESLEPLTVLDRPGRMALAVWMGSTRLIDNLAIPPAAGGKN